MGENYIKVEQAILKDCYTVEYTIKCSDTLKHFFIENKKMFVKYKEDISNVPSSILLIPLLYNIAPITWFTDAELIIDEVDKEFIESFEDIKKGFQEMYKDLKIGGKVYVNNIVDNRRLNMTKKSATLFSGGVDSWSTYLSHIDEKPSLITVKGADIDLDDAIGWNIVKSKIEDIGRNNNSKCIFIESNFKVFLNQDNLSLKFKDYMYGWWASVQHSLGIVGLIAPITYVDEITQIYVPATYTKEFNKPWGSDPKIDNYIRWSNLTSYHDGYELSRQDKINLITGYVKNDEKKYLDIRVCWEGKGGVNCCKCEKCSRTILGIIIAGENPKEYGFDVDNSIYSQIKSKFRKGLWAFSDDEIFMWSDIKRNIKDESYDMYNKDFLRWLRDYDIISYAKKSNNILSKIYRKVYKYL